MCNWCKWAKIGLLILIIVFTIWKTTASFVIVLISAIILLLKELIFFGKSCIFSCYKEKGVYTYKGPFEHKTGEELFIEKNPKPEYPSKHEVEETLKKRR